LLNVACDPTRELWAELNVRFIAAYETKRGIPISIGQSHGGSGSQARAVIDGLEADVVTLAMWPDTDAIRKAGRIATGWEDRLPNRGLPYTSTIVFVVRAGNPKSIRDWADLDRDNVNIISPNPKTSGNGKWSVLASWAASKKAGLSDDAAEARLQSMFRRVPVLDPSARGATMTFSQKNIGDVHLTWENEAYLEVHESKGKLEVVYPTVSILAEPHVAIVDAVVDRKGTREVAEAYMDFLYTPEAQAIIAKHRYRPTNAAVKFSTKADFPELELVSIRELGFDWDGIQKRFFAEGAMFDRITSGGRKR